MIQIRAAIKSIQQYAIAKSLEPKLSRTVHKSISYRISIILPNSEDRLLWKSPQTIGLLKQLYHARPAPSLSMFGNGFFLSCLKSPFRLRISLFGFTLILQIKSVFSIAI